MPACAVCLGPVVVDPVADVTLDADLSLSARAMRAVHATRLGLTLRELARKLGIAPLTKDYDTIDWALRAGAKKGSLRAESDGDTGLPRFRSASDWAPPRWRRPRGEE